MKKIGLGHTPPVNEAIPLGQPTRPLRVKRPAALPVPAFVQTAAYAGTMAVAGTEKTLDILPSSRVELPLSPMSGALKEKQMTLTLKNLSKNGKQAIYAGAALSIRIPVKAFVGGTAPQTFTVTDDLFAAPRQPKVTLTAAERKAERLANPRPKLTIAERARKARERADKLDKLAEADSVHASM